MKELFLLKLGEIVLKGLNRRKFEDRLTANISRRIHKYGRFRIYARQSTVYVEPLEAACDLERAWAAIQPVFGVAGLSRAKACEKDKDAFFETASTYLHDQLMAAKTFKVESKRADKSFPMTSIELSQYVGGMIHDAYPHLKVDVHDPEFTIHLEVRDFSGYVHGNPTPGAGGLPVGASLDDLGKGLRSQVGTMFGTKAKGARYLELAQGYVTRMALNDKNEIIAFEFLNLGKFTDAVKAGKTPEEAIAGAMGHYGQWENAAKYIDPRTDEETHSVASVFPVHE